MKISVRKLSELSGFSPATVSNALNHKKGVNRETAEKILQLADEWGYQTLSKVRRVRFVIFRRNGRIIDDSPFHPAVMKGVEKQAKKLGYETVYDHIDISRDNYRQSIREIISDVQSVVILLGTEMQEEDFALFSPAKNKLLVLDGFSETCDFDSVLINNLDAAYQAVKYLQSQGHREIGYLRGDFRIKAFAYRELGYFRALAEAGLTAVPEFQVTVGTQTWTAYADMKAYLAAAETLPSAFFADNDVIAIGAMKALKEAGVAIPGEVSLVGFDDISFGAIADPPLSTVHVFKQEMGEAAVRYLLQSEDEHRIKTQVQVCPEFVERGSVRNIR